VTRGRLLASPRWPSQIVLVRHGESTGNLANTAARGRGDSRLDLNLRDADVPLSKTGREQATAVGDVLRDRGEEQGPQLVVSSPYQRAAETAFHALKTWEAGREDTCVLDERLRERDLGLFNGLTSSGIREEYPAEARRRKSVGKFYYQPPSGESWCDVVLRVRSFMVDLQEGYADRRVWLFTHQAVIMCFRYVLENLTEQEVLELEASRALPNCSMTTYLRGADGLALETFADTSAVDRAPAQPTAEPAEGGRTNGAP
jgi:broad specificity phosphatase PhoE